jgi:hypothetical protein
LLERQEPGRQEEIMKVRKSIVAAVAAVVVGTSGALALPTLASAHDSSCTLTFTVVTLKTVTFTRSTFGSQEKDVNSAGKTIGFDDGYVTFAGTNTVTINAAFDFKGGFLYGELASANGGLTFSGKVTGGTGAFQGATGTIRAKTISSTKTAVTIIYS